MSKVWSPQSKFETWRFLWIALAEGQRELGLDISEGQIAEMKAMATTINFDVADAKEKEFRHDVMAHIHAYGEQCPAARPIIHLGATSCYVADNGDLVQIRDALRLIRRKLTRLIDALSTFATKHAALPQLGYTHFQPAQLVTVGKRACLWLQDLVMDAEAVEEALEKLPFRGVKGTTGTQATFLELFEGDHDKVRALDAAVTRAMGFSRTVGVCGQTYSRKVDFQVMSALSGVAQSLHKLCTDIRLLQNMRELEEPFGKHQIGSSAMAYKRNPMRSERVCALARHVITLTANAANTHAVQWLERTLDDSANRRLSIPEAFLALDVALTTTTDVCSGLMVWDKVVAAHVAAELPFMATEAILMATVRAGGDRQTAHEAIRTHSMEAARRVKGEGAANDLLSRLRTDPVFAAVASEIDQLTDPQRFTGRAEQQVAEFVAEYVEPLLQRRAADLEGDSIDTVNV